MKKIFLSLAVIALLASCGETAVEASDAEVVEMNETEETVSLETISDESNVKWRATHFGGAGERYGIIKLKEASFLVNDNQLSNVKVVIDMGSFTVDSFSDEEAEDRDKLTGHLQSADFFDIENHPNSTFEMTDIKASEGDYNSVVTGNLTIMDVTKSISFNANVAVSEDNASIKSETFHVDRRDWNLTYHVEGSEGVPIDYIIANELGFTIDVTVGK